MTWIADVMAIAIGGAGGAIMRYGITAAVMTATARAWLSPIARPIGGPSALGTTAANLIGCALLGGLIAYSSILAEPSSASPRLILMIRVGFLGSLTTLSTWIAEMVLLGQSGRWSAVVWLLLVNVILGTLTLLVGMGTVRTWMTT
ncbi:MAG: CrcB family protein [Planctomycetota bacterium]